MRCAVMYLSIENKLTWVILPRSVRQGDIVSLSPQLYVSPTQLLLAYRVGALPKLLILYFFVAPIRLIGWQENIIMWSFSSIFGAYILLICIERVFKRKAFVEFINRCRAKYCYNILYKSDLMEISLSMKMHVTSTWFQLNKEI